MNDRSFDSNRSFENPSCALFLVLVLVPLGVLSFQMVVDRFFSSPPNKTSEAKQYVSSMAKAQMAAYLEHNTFAKTWDRLGISLKPETQRYQYSMEVTEKATFNYGVPKSEQFKSAVSAVFVNPVSGIDPLTQEPAQQTLFILCEATTPGIVKPEKPIYQKGKLLCGKGTAPLK